MFQSAFLQTISVGMSASIQKGSQADGLAKAKIKMFYQKKEENLPTSNSLFIFAL